MNESISSKAQPGTATDTSQLTVDETESSATASQAAQAVPPVAELHTKLDPEAAKKLFPVFSNHAEYIFFDNASTTQKPASVIADGVKFRTSECANPGRGTYKFATRAARKIEEARCRVAAFLNAKAADIAFTSGATESLNLSALSWGLANLADGDEIMVCLEDHKSTVYPWFVVKDILEQRGCRIKVVPFSLNEKGCYDQASIKSGFNSKTRLIALTQVHNLFGVDTGVANIRSIVGKDVVVSLDASQSVGHCKVDLQKLDIDMLSFSGHKMFADYGVGVLWLSPRIQASLKPARLGGGTPASLTGGVLSLTSTSVQTLFESGSPNVPAIASMTFALDAIEALGVEQIEDHLDGLTRHLLQVLKPMQGIEFAPGAAHDATAKGCGIVSFRFEQVGSAELAFALGEEKILVRGGDHCLSKQAAGGWLRVSMHVYNSTSEIDALAKCLQRLLEADPSSRVCTPTDC